MRVIAGEARGRRLVAPRGDVTRPATDRLRESLFGTLGERCRDARALDLFAGSGSLGIEALSRGAAHATFVERDRPALDAIRRNLESTGLQDRATVVRAEVDAFVRATPETYDVVFCDPPYADMELLALLLAGPDLRRVAVGTLVVRALKRHAPGIPEHWAVERERAVGEDLIRLLR